MKTRTIELNNLQGNALHFSHRQYPFDFVSNPIMFRIYFDGDTFPSIDTASNILIMDTRQSNMEVFIVNLWGDSARIELQAMDDEHLNGIEVAEVHIPYLNYPDTTPNTHLLQNFLNALRIRGYWGKDFFNRNEAMAAIKHVSEDHFSALNDFFSTYEAYQNNRLNRKLFKQDRLRWLQIDKQRNQQLLNSWHQLQEFCHSKGISLKGVTYL